MSEELLKPLQEAGIQCAVAATDATRTLYREGDCSAVYPLASVSKLFTAYSALIACERGLLDLDEPAEPEGATVRHLLSHAAGYSFADATPIGRVGARRGYSNYGIEVLAAHVEDATGYPIGQWLETSLIAPLGMRDVDTAGSPAAGFSASVEDLLLLGREFLAPTLVSPELFKIATNPVFPGLSGVLPGFGRQKDNAWGLGFEIKADKSPHWTGSSQGPRTFGHFGQSGSFLWVEPDLGLACAFLGDKPFSEAHAALWPTLSDRVVAACR
ncbi:serine hydrolase domain-containing protein [Dermabacteraceae bacterium P9123]